LEDYLVIKRYLDRYISSWEAAVAYEGRELNEVQKLLVSPDYASNFRAAEFAGLVSGDLERIYNEALSKLKSGAFDQLLIIGDRAIIHSDINSDVLTAVSGAQTSIALLCDRTHPLAVSVKTVFPVRSILEKNGLMINRAGRMQYSEACIEVLAGTEPEWRVLSLIADGRGEGITSADGDRECTLFLLAREKRLREFKLRDIKAGGVQLMDKG
jgi:NADH dehydrogenase/NADH:ubiquinone oxidoreductase subunit G